MKFLLPVLAKQNERIKWKIMFKILKNPLEDQASGTK